MDKPYALNTWLDTETRIKLNQKSDLKAILILVGQISIYVICLVGAIADYSIFGNVVFSIYIGLVIGQIFIIGHDACHQALAKSLFLNKIIGRFTKNLGLKPRPSRTAFLPASVYTIMISIKERSKSGLGLTQDSKWTKNGRKTRMSGNPTALSSQPYSE